MKIDSEFNSGHQHVIYSRILSHRVAGRTVVVIRAMVIRHQQAIVGQARHPSGAPQNGDKGYVKVHRSSVAVTLGRWPTSET